MKLKVTRVSNHLYEEIRRSQQIGRRASRIQISIYKAFAIGILTLLTLVEGSAQSQNSSVPNRLNAGLFAALEIYENTHSAAALNQLQFALASRRQTLSNAISSNPALVLASALPDDIKRHVPASLQALVEQHVNLRGTAEVAIEDGPNYSRIDYGLKIAGERLQLHFAGGAPSDWLTDTNVQVSGVQIGNAIALSAKDASVLE